jgi:hypothetical protein
MSGSQLGGESEEPTEPHPSDYDFRQHLYDTIILLGGKKEIADILVRSQDYQVSQSDIDELKNYNVMLIENLKFRRANIRKSRIRPEST